MTTGPVPVVTAARCPSGSQVRDWVGVLVFARVVVFPAASAVKVRVPGALPVLTAEVVKCGPADPGVGYDNVVAVLVVLVRSVIETMLPATS